MNRYPFLIRSPGRTKQVHAEGESFGNALSKVLSVHPSRFVNFKYAKNMDLINVKQIVINLSKKNKGVEHTIWLNEKEGEFYIAFKNDKGFTQMVEDETDLVGVEIGTARLNKYVKQSVWVTGVEVTTSPAAETSKPVRSKKRMSEEIMEEAEKVEQAEKELKKAKLKQPIKQSSADVNANTMTKKATKKAAPKKAAKKTVSSTIVGDKKELSVKAILELFKKGVRVYRQANPTNGGLLSVKKLTGYANKDKTIAVIVVKAA